VRLVLYVIWIVHDMSRHLHDGQHILHCCADIDVERYSTVQILGVLHDQAIKKTSMQEMDVGKRHLGKNVTRKKWQYANLEKILNVLTN